MEFLLLIVFAIVLGTFINIVLSKLQNKDLSYDTKKPSIPRITDTMSNSDLATLEQKVLALINSGKKIEAIKEVRIASNLPLKESKELVDKLENGESFLKQSQITNSKQEIDSLASQQVIGLVASGKKIEAIKQYRLETGLGLAESKELIDQIEKQLNNPN